MYQRSKKLVTDKFFEFFVPTILMAASSSLSIIIDSIIVGNVLGSSELAAMNLIMPATICIGTIGVFFGIGGSNLISVLKGQLDHENADKIFTVVCISWLIFGLLISLVGIFCTQAIASFFSGSSSSELQSLVAEYLRVFLIGAPIAMSTLIFPYIIKVDGKPKLGSNALIVANIVNLVMDIVYMKYLHMGLAGGALASITGYTVGFCMFLTYLKSPLRTIHFTKVKLSDFKHYVEIFQYSISTTLGQGLMFAKIWIINMIISSIAGKSGLVAFSVCISCLSFVSMFIAGAAQTMMPLVASFSGARDLTAKKTSVMKSFYMVIIGCIIVTILFEFIPQVILGIYGITDHVELMDGIVAIRIFSISLTGIGFTFFMMYYAQVISRPTFSLQICGLEGFVSIVPLCFVFSKLWGVNGIWIAYIVNEIISFFFIFIKSKRFEKKSNGTLYSIFLLEHDTEKRYEVTLQLDEPEEYKKILEEINDFLKRECQITDTHKVSNLVSQCITLMEYTYTEAKKKKASIADLIVKKEEDKIFVELKNAGTPIQTLENNQKSEQQTKTYLNNIKESSDSFEHSMLIGLNYIKASCICK